MQGRKRVRWIAQIAGIAKNWIMKSQTHFGQDRIKAQSVNKSL